MKGIFGIASLLILSACCNSRSSSGSEQASQPAASKRSPIDLAECKASTDGNVGNFKATSAQVSAAAEAMPKTCLPGTRVADALAACAEQVGPLCVASVQAPDYSACQYTVKTLETSGRKFISIEAFIGEGAKFHGEVFIFEMNGVVPTSYYTGFVGDENCQQGKGATAKLKSDWSSLGAAAQKFICPG